MISTLLQRYYNSCCAMPKRCMLLLLLLLSFSGLQAQKYNFINFNVENGLVQSQATVFAQDQNNELLIGTYGGLSIFDGSNFVNYNKGKGLPQNLISALACDQSRNIWVGTPNGIARYNGKQFQTFYPSAKAEENGVKQIKVDRYNKVWAIAYTRLCQFDGKKFTPDKTIDTALGITLDKSGKLWAIRYHKGIYVHNGKDWHKEIDLSADKTLFVFDITFGAYSGTLYCLTNKGIMVAENGTLKSPEWLETLPHGTLTNNLLEDSKGNIWLSFRDGGAWVYSQKKWVHYTYTNGLTDDKVSSFYEDAEGNVWLATDGSGIFRYTGSLFTYYDRGTGLPSPSIMSIAQGRRGEIYFASSNTGLYRLNNGTPQKVNLPDYALRINSILMDSTGKLLIGTDDAGLWYHDGIRTNVNKESIKLRIAGISNLYRYYNTTWISSRAGLFKLENGHISEEHVPYALYAAHAINKDSLLIGTIKGAYIYRTDTREMIPQPLLANATVLCFESDNRYIYIGTDDRGVVIWDKTNKSFKAVNQKTGLSCEYVYSLLMDRDNNLWVGTGCGIDKISFTPQGLHIKSFGKSDGLLGVESNANASFQDREGYLWFGTTRGVFRYNPYVTFAQQQAPKVVLQSVKLYSKDIPTEKFSDSIIPFSGLPWHPVLQTNQNHLTFSFKGVYLSNPDKIRYRYQLVGIDKTYTETDQTTVVYPNLPPGDYLFKVWASDAEGTWYNNAVSYPFIINTPYYTTWYFRFGIGLLAIGIFLGAVYYRNRQKELRRHWEEQLRDEQQALVRQKTAEDFHDEIGNKLTRINLLATIAEGKVHPSAPDIKNILQQIQKNVTSLYNGSKDIIWSLQPESDYLDEILFRIRQNTAELLQDTSLQFDYEEGPELDTHIRLPIDYSRNMIMIFKEAVNNIVKHAGATSILMTVKKEQDRISLLLKDNGKGFDKETIYKGNGLGNISNRASRIGAELTLDSIPGSGTTIALTLKV
jgi:signal transduction histidine kinase/ligand-binding sensor domain-containing protein